MCIRDRPTAEYKVAITKKPKHNNIRLSIGNPMFLYLIHSAGKIDEMRIGTSIEKPPYSLFTAYTRLAYDIYAMVKINFVLSDIHLGQGNILGDFQMISHKLLGRAYI